MRGRIKSAAAYILYRGTSGHASVQTSGFSLTLRNRGKGGWARDLRQNCLPRYSAGVKSRSVVLGYPS